jgi:hypothetical protein
VVSAFLAMQLGQIRVLHENGTAKLTLQEQHLKSVIPWFGTS